MKEVWKDISNYETYYEVSNLGRVRNKKRDKEKKQTIKKDILKIINNKRRK